MWKVVSLLTFYSVVALGKSEVSFPLEFSIMAPNPITTIQETMVVQKDGAVSLTTLSPFSESPPENTIGEFSTSLDEGTLGKLKTLVLTTTPSVHGEKEFPPESMVFSLKQSKTQSIDWQYDGSPTSQQWKDLYIAIREKSLKTPVAALRLRCESDDSGFFCVMRNIGEKNVSTVNPLTVSRSLACLPDSGIPVFFAVPRNKTYDTVHEKIEIRPGASRSFHIDTKDHCTTRIRVDTTSVRFNPAYHGVVAGELISNELK